MPTGNSKKKTARTKKSEPTQWRTDTQADKQLARASERAYDGLNEIINFEMPEEKRQALKAIATLRKAVDEMDRVLGSI